MKIFLNILWLVVAIFIEISGDSYAISTSDFSQNLKGQSTSFSFLRDPPTHVSGKIIKYAELSSDKQILFSDDGLQPTAAEAVIWSCANIEDECVTAWYEPMFRLYEIFQEV